MLPAAAGFSGNAIPALQEILLPHDPLLTEFGIVRLISFFIFIFLCTDHPLQPIRREPRYLSTLPGWLLRTLLVVPKLYFPPLGPLN
jgi:hypothetical protein